MTDSKYEYWTFIMNIKKPNVWNIFSTADSIDEAKFHIKEWCKHNPCLIGRIEPVKVKA